MFVKVGCKERLLISFALWTSGAGHYHHSVEVRLAAPPSMEIIPSPPPVLRSDCLLSEPLPLSPQTQRALESFTFDELPSNLLDSVGAPSLDLGGDWWSADDLDKILDAGLVGSDSNESSVSSSHKLPPAVLPTTTVTSTTVPQVSLSEHAGQSPDIEPNQLETYMIGGVEVRLRHTCKCYSGCYQVIVAHSPASPRDGGPEFLGHKCRSIL